MSALHASIPGDFVSLVAGEIASSVDTAVEFWMAQVEGALQDDRLTTLGRMNAVQAVLASYKHLTGKTELHGRDDGPGQRGAVSFSQSTRRL